MNKYIAIKNKDIQLGSWAFESSILQLELDSKKWFKLLELDNNRVEVSLDSS